MNEPCCNGHCDQGRSCPNRATAQQKPFWVEVFNYLAGLATAALIVFAMFAILYLFMPGI